MQAMQYLLVALVIRLFSLVSPQLQMLLAPRRHYRLAEDIFVSRWPRHTRGIKRQTERQDVCVDPGKALG
jgi:hypothetical protein